MLTKWIISRIPNHVDVKNERVRSAYGKAASLVGIGCNMLLFAGKLVAGLLSGSVAIMADAVNNLSDVSSSLISLLGFKLADRPADAEHPYGHGRFEYLSGMTVAVMILVIGVELLKSSVGKIFAPEPVTFSWVSVGVLASSAGVPPKLAPIACVPTESDEVVNVAVPSAPRATGRPSGVVSASNCT